MRVYDSYAHHPTEIAGDLQSARLLAGDGRVVVAFQPHLVSRTRIFGAAMGAALGAADEVVVLDVYLAREDADPAVTRALVADAVPPARRARSRSSRLDDAAGRARRPGATRRPGAHPRRRHRHRGRARRCSRCSRPGRRPLPVAAARSARPRRSDAAGAQPAPLRPAPVGAPLAHLALLLVAVVVLVRCVGGGIYAVYFSDALSVQGVEVVGAEDPRARPTCSRPPPCPTGGPLATVDLDAIERRVEASTPSRSVEVSREWPHDVLIDVAERVPVAVVDRGGDLRAVDADGRGLRQLPPRARGLPRIETADVTDADALRRRPPVVAALPDRGRASIVDHVEVRQRRRDRPGPRDGREVRWGSAEASEQKAEVLAALLEQPARGLRRQRPRPADHRRG